MEVLSEATTRMTEAELLQLAKIADPTITEGEYMAIVTGKTAALMSAACRVGAILAGRPEAEELALAEFGRKLGMAFQIADDLLDYRASEEKLGKSLGKDLGEGKITLPVIDLLRKADAAESARLTKIIEAETLEKLDLEYIMGLFGKYRCLEASQEKAGQVIAEAKAALSVFPSGRARDALLLIADHALAREH
jgi:octaprenyl-diphosphate synthase